MDVANLGVAEGRGAVTGLDEAGVVRDHRSQLQWNDLQSETD